MAGVIPTTGGSEWSKPTEDKGYVTVSKEATIGGKSYTIKAIIPRALLDSKDENVIKKTLQTIQPLIDELLKQADTHGSVEYKTPDASDKSDLKELKSWSVLKGQNVTTSLKEGSKVNEAVAKIKELGVRTIAVDYVKPAIQVEVKPQEKVSAPEKKVEGKTIKRKMKSRELGKVEHIEDA